MLIVFIEPPSEIKRAVSTTSDFQRTGADILQVSDNQQQNFRLYEQLTAENGLKPDLTMAHQTQALLTSPVEGHGLQNESPRQGQLTCFPRNGLTIKFFHNNLKNLA